MESPGDIRDSKVKSVGPVYVTIADGSRGPKPPMTLEMLSQERGRSHPERKGFRNSAGRFVILKRFQSACLVEPAPGIELSR